MPLRMRNPESFPSCGDVKARQGASGRKTLFFFGDAVRVRAIPMTDTFTEVTTQSWFSRIKNAFAGLLIGLIFFVGAFPMLTWNEKRSIERTRALRVVAAETTTVDPAQLNPAVEGKPVHFTGRAETATGIKDDLFGISEPALKLDRTVEMYQWKEEKDTKTTEKMGGSSQTTTTYRYTKAWADEALDSASFQHPGGHENPAQLLYPNKLTTAQPITVGAYQLTDSIVAGIGGWEDYPAPPVEKLPESIRAKAKASGSLLYFGADPGAPAIGDHRVSFRIVRPHDVSIVAAQVGNSLDAYHSKHGDVLLIQDGVHNAETMFRMAQDQNKMVTWLLRLLFFVLMALGLVLLLNPLKVLADVVPLIGSVVGAGTGLIAFVLAGALSCATIALAWLAFRPLIGVPLLLVTVGLFVFAGRRMGQAKSS